MKKLSLDELKRISVDEFKGKKKLSISIVLDNIRSLSNVGSFFRTADAFLIKKIYLTGITAKPPHREIRKTALGATESVDWEFYSDPRIIISELKEKGCTIVGIEQTTNSIFLQNFEPSISKEYCLIFGNEVNGISDDLLPLLDFAIEIPQFGTKHSLNVSVSAGIVMWKFVENLQFSK